MGLERTHFLVVGQGEGLAVMGFGGLALGVRGDAEVQVRQRVEGAIPLAVAKARARWAVRWPGHSRP